MPAQPKRYYLSLNRAYQGKPPAEPPPGFWRHFNGQFQNERLTLEEFAQAIRSGYAYTTWHREYRRADNFFCGQLIACDFDTEDERSTIQALAADPFIARFGSLLHTSASHTAEKPRARVVFLLDRPLRDREKYTLLAQALLFRYQIADEKCKDACRLYFGATECDQLLLGGELTLEAAAEHLVAPYRAHLAEEEAKRHAEWEASRERRAARAVTASDKRIAAYIQKALDQESERAATQGSGGRHNAILHGAMILGKLLNSPWVPSDAIAEADIYAALIAAAKRNKLWDDDGEQSVKDTIAAGIKHAKDKNLSRLEPDWSEEEERPASPQPSVILPEVLLTPEQLQREAEAIARIREEGWWEGFHEGLTVAQRGLWHQHGIHDAAINYYQLGYSTQRGALTIPYLHKGEITNIEYRHGDGTVEYESDLIPPLFVAYENDAPCLIVDDALAAMETAMRARGSLPALLKEHAVMGLPKLPLRAESWGVLGDRPAVALVGPEVRDEQVKALEKKAKVLRLPIGLAGLVKMGLSDRDLRWNIRQAR